MAENKTININIKDNADKAEQSFKSYNKELGNTKKQYDAVLKSGKPFDQQLEDINRIVKETPLNVRDMNKQIQAYQSIALSAGRETPVGRKALEEAAQLRDRYIDIQNETKRLADDQRNLEGAIQGISTGVAIYGGIQSAMALTGVESEELRKTLVKLQAAQTLMNSINQVATALEKESALMLTLKGARTKALTAATAAYAAVTGTATGALKVFRLALISTGIGAIVVGVGLLVANFDKLKGALGGGIDGFKKMGVVAKLAMLPLLPLIAAIDLVKAGLEKLNILNTKQEKQIERQLDLQNQQLEVTKKQIAKRLEQIKLEARYREDRLKNLELDLQAAETDEERAKIQKQITDETLKGFEDERNAIRENHKTAIANATIRLNNLIKQYNEENNSIFINRQNLEKYYKYYRDQERYVNKLKKQLREDDFQSIVEIDTKQREYLENQRRDEEKKEKESNKRKQDDYKNYLQNRLNARRKIEDLENELLEEGVEKEVAISNKKFDRLIEDALANEKFTADEKNKIRDLLLVQQFEAEDEIRKTFRNQELQEEIDFFTENKLPVLEAIADEEVKVEINKYSMLGQVQKKAFDDEKARRQKLQDFAINSTLSGLQTISDITELFGKKGEKQARRAFQVQKAVNIAQALISTYQGANAIFASAAANPKSVLFPAQPFIAAGLAVAGGLANVAKIASQKFEGGGAAGNGAQASAPDLTGGETVAPSFNVVGDAGINQLAQLQQQPTQAFVVSGEVTSAQALDRNRVTNATL